MLPRLHIVTDDGVLRSERFAAAAESLVRSYGPAIALHLRGHGVSGAELFALAHPLAHAAHESGALLLVNDRVDIALLVGARGVQLGRRSLPIRAARQLLGPAALVGYSAHEPSEAEEAIAASADFLLVGALYATPTHPSAAPAGPALLHAVRARVAAPLIAIGGITPARAAAALTAGAAGVAVVSGVWSAPDPAAAVALYLDALEEKRS